MFFLQETKTKEMPKSLKIDAYSEARQRVFAAVSVKFVAAKYDLTATRTKFTAAKVSRSKGLGVQTESTRCSENWSHCSEDTSS